MADENDRHRLMAEEMLKETRARGLSSKMIDQLHAAAQVEATLALVEEVRTLSLATLGASDGLGAGLANAQVRRRLGL